MPRTSALEPAQPWSARCNPRVLDGFVGVSASSWPELPSPHYSSCKHVPGGPNESPRGGQRGEATSSPCPFMLTDLSLSVCTGSSVQEGRAKPPRSNVGTSWSCDAKTTQRDGEASSLHPPGTCGGLGILTTCRPSQDASWPGLLIWARGWSPPGPG